jgi:hypothetical protein
MPYEVQIRLRFSSIEDEKDLRALKKDIEELVKKYKREVYPIEVQYRILQELAESID